MKIILEPAEAENMFYTALCNIGGQLRSYGIELELDQDPLAYPNARKRLTDANPGCGPCLEDVIMEMLRGGDPLYFVDHDNGGDYSQVVTLAMVHERVQMTPVANLLRIKAEEDDADDADAILQTVLYKEIIFG